jgi:hypothetical protein
MVLSSSPHHGASHSHQVTWLISQGPGPPLSPKPRDGDRSNNRPERVDAEMSAPTPESFVRSTGSFPAGLPAWVNHSQTEAIGGCVHDRNVTILRCRDIFVRGAHGALRAFSRRGAMLTTGPQRCLRRSRVHTAEQPFEVGWLQCPVVTTWHVSTTCLSRGETNPPFANVAHDCEGAYP